MPGYNHYPWCTCGWCYKTGWNFYSPRTTRADFDRAYAERRLSESGIKRSWTACFINPNAWCPVCGTQVFFYANQHGSRVFFDELGWPWPKHPCTDNRRPARGYNEDIPQPMTLRSLGEVADILDLAKLAGFDPNAGFRSRHGSSPWDLLIVEKVKRTGFENKIQATSISPHLDDPVFIAFTSAKHTPSVGDYISFNGSEVSVFDQERVESRRLKARPIQATQLDPHEALGRAR